MSIHSRRTFICNAVGMGGLALSASAETTIRKQSGKAGESKPPSPPPFKLGLVTYQLAAEWDLETIIKNCEDTGFEAVELRTTHKHGVEPSLAHAQRLEVRKQFEASRVRLLSLGTACEYHSPDSAVVEKNIEETKRFCALAKDLGALGVKVRPNALPPGIPRERTLDQIGRALRKCGQAARDAGVEIWLEVHGPRTAEPANIHYIMQVANHPSVGVCWNSNPEDVTNGSVRVSYRLLSRWIWNVHINELWKTEYPWRELFQYLRGQSYDRYTLAEIPGNCEPLRLMRYYRSLWQYHAG